MNPFPYKYFD